MSIYKTVEGIEEDFHNRFAVDANDRVYITRWKLQTLTAAKGSDTFHPLSWRDYQVHARHLICERVESSILKVVFPNLKLSGNGSECIWALFEDYIGLYHVDTETLMQVTSPGYARVDGPVLVSPQRTPQSSGGTLENTTTFMSMKSSIVILEGYSIFRILDLSTWTIRTLITLKGDTYSIYPTCVLSTPIPFIASQDYIMIEHKDGVYRLDLKTGKTSKPPPIELYGYSYKHCFPIPTSRDSLAYIFRNDNLCQLLRIVNGMEQTVEFELGKGHSAAHVSSTGLTLKSINTQASCKSFFSYEDHWKLHQAPAPDRLALFDLSSLIDSDLPHDLTIKHSSRKWNLPLSIVTDLHPSFDGPELNKLIKIFPASSVEALIGRMLGKQLPDAVCVDSCRIWSHVSYMWRAIDCETNPVLNYFVFSVLPYLPDDVACNSLIDIWNDEKTNWAQDDLIVLYMARHVKNSCLKMFSTLLLSQLSTRNMELALAMIDMPNEDEDCSNEGEEELGLAAIHLKKTPLPESGDLETLLALPTDFVFVLGTIDDPYAIVGDMRYLYTRWRWFKRLIEVGGEEKKNRIARMPVWMSMSVLRAILGHIHEEWFDEVLSVSDALELLEHRHEFDICDADDEPIDPFVALYDHCMTVVFHDVSRNNLLEQIVNYQRLGMDSKVASLLSLVATGKYEFGALELIKALSLDLLALVKTEAAP